MGAIKIENLAREIEKALDEYSSEVNEKMAASAKKVAADCATDVKRRASALFGSGPYAKDWAYKETYNRKGSVHYTVYNKKHYQLTHLLEFGHAKWLWGKKTGGTVSGRAHIRPAEEKVIKEFSEELRTRLG